MLHFERRHEAAIQQEMRTGLGNVAAPEMEWNGAPKLSPATAESLAYPALGNRVYELGVRTERQHSPGLPIRGERNGNHNAMFLDRRS